MNVFAPELRAALMQHGQAPRALLSDAQWDALDAAGLALVRRGDAMHLPALVRDWVDAQALATALSDDAPCPVRNIQVALSVDSTNTRALAAGAPPHGSCDVWLADHQGAGRGRRGQRWHSPFASGLCLTLVTALPTRADLAALPLVLGLGVRRALLAAGADSVQLKWPNDLVVAGRKLGGILVQSRYMAGRAPVFAMGVGLNVHAAPPVTQVRGLPPVALAEVLAARTPPRTALAAALVRHWRQLLHAFARDGFAPLRAEWAAADSLHGRRIEVGDPVQLTGTACGVDACGQLRLQTDTGETAVACSATHVRACERAA